MVDDTDCWDEGTDVEVGQLHQHSIVAKEIVVMGRSLLPWQQVPPDQNVVTLEVVVYDSTSVQILEAVCNLVQDRGVTEE